MTEYKKKKRRKLSHEILGLLAVSVAISLFLFEFLHITATSIANAYFEYQDLTLTYAQEMTVETWIFSMSLLTTVLFFVVLFLLLLGQKIAYIHNITEGVEALRAHRMDYTMPLEGNNELTELAETMNYLSATERKIRERERELHEEKEQLIRTLSHDIRTPLTSIMAYSELMISKEDCTLQEQRDHLELIQKKAQQIKELTDILLDGGQRNPEHFEDARLLMAQLAEEFEETLEEEYTVSVDLTNCGSFSGTFDVQELRRIFDNLASNIRKYADPERSVRLIIRAEGGALTIYQENYKRVLQEQTESYQMGLNSIRRIAHNYGGHVEVQSTDDQFSITIWLSEIL